MKLNLILPVIFAAAFELGENGELIPLDPGDLDFEREGFEGAVPENLKLASKTGVL